MFKCGVKLTVVPPPPSHDPRTALTLSRGPDIVLMIFDPIMKRCSNDRGHLAGPDQENNVNNTLTSGQ